MDIIYYDEALADIEFWKKSGNKTIQKKIQQLIIAILKDPYEGIGKPEPLKHDLSSLWSRRINREHRIIYQILNDALHIHSLRGHYK
ncbi:toxin of toxin-antitoxin system [Pedobacter sp. Leaf216]|uniref:Txe/YoeB family addiction module toxin n=1 Tax=Pedobacter sp. Leaf216 TaxID=1735684 RepID=UPI0006FCD632|nr:Txe/YoeB family addiction module toxin [Pedobacter sp. Leaf216]KQM64554.1 toxin of toxin-antitoxin system [Pedobacter sp. Leaf216]